MFEWSRDVGSAQGAAGAALQPGVGAVDVEGVRAGGQEFERVVAAQLGQTDGALILHCCGGGRCEFYDGEDADDVGVEAAGLGRGVGESAAERGGGGETASGDEEVVAEEDDGGGEDA